MAVRQLAGPFTMQLSQGTISTDPDNLTPSFQQTYAWLPHVGLLMDCSFCSGYSTLDGIVEALSFYLRFNTVGWWAQAQQLFVVRGFLDGWEEWSIDHHLFIAKKKIGSGKTLDWLFFAKTYVKLADGTLLMPSINLLKFVKDGEPTREILAPMFVNHVWAGRHVDEVFLSGENGQTTKFTFYNVAKDEFEPIQTIGIPSDHLAYVPEHNILVSTHGGSELRVWSLEVLPTQLSQPQLIEGQAKGGHIATFQVQALGAQDDPAEGELIDWSIVGTGSMLDVQSVTDKEGYAKARVKFGLSDSGQCQLTAGLRC